MLLTNTDLPNGKRFQFNTYGAVGGIQQFTGDIVGFVDGSAIPTEANGAVNHANIWTTLPQPVQDLIQNDYTSYNYFIVKADDNTNHYIGAPWIEPATLQEDSIRFVDIRLKNFNEPDFNRLRQILLLSGYRVDSVTE